jgi:hypothetical protein
MRGASVKAVQEHLSPTMISMTQKYSHLGKDFQKEEIQRLNGSCGESNKKSVRNELLTRNYREVPANATA